MSVVVAAARGWIGTPYVHQASVRGAGADCLGLIRGVWREIHGKEPEEPPPCTADWGETGREELLLAAGLRHMAPATGDWAEGQVLLFRMREGAVAKHLGYCRRRARMRGSSMPMTATGSSRARCPRRGGRGSWRGSRFRARENRAARRGGRCSLT